MNLKHVETLNDIAKYAEALVNDIESGITHPRYCNAELVANFAVHCAEIAVAKRDKFVEKILKDENLYRKERSIYFEVNR